MWVVILFGMSASPWIFRKILQPVTQFLREEGLRIALFVDDFLQMMRKCDVLSHSELLLDTLSDLGWSVNKEKSQLIPSTCCTFIGFDVHLTRTRGPWIKVLPGKVRKLKTAIRGALNRDSLMACQLAKIAGQCIAMMHAVIPAKLLLCNIYQCIHTKESWQSRVILNKHVKEDLRWWLVAIDNWNGAPLCLKQPDIQLECDASSSGWGSVIPSLNLEASGTWDKLVSFKHSNYRELFTILISVIAFKEQLKNKSVQVLTDNVTAAAYVNHLGGQNPEFHIVVNTLFAECQDNDIQISAHHLAGILNFWSDQLSRQASPLEWQLHPRLFEALDNLWGPHDVDRFTSWRTTHLQVYNSYFC